MPEPRVRKQNQPISKEDRKRGWQWLWHPFWVQGLVCVCPVVGPLLPWPTTGYRLPNPAGLVSESEIRTQPCRTDLKSLMQPWQKLES